MSIFIQTNYSVKMLDVRFQSHFIKWHLALLKHLNLGNLCENNGQQQLIKAINKLLLRAIYVCSRKYFLEICDVEEPEVHFNMDQYTDVTRVTKPIIYISIAEIVDTHRVGVCGYFCLWLLVFVVVCVCGYFCLWWCLSLYVFVVIGVCGYFCLWLLVFVVISVCGCWCLWWLVLVVVGVCVFYI